MGRIRNKELIQVVRTLACLACRTSPVDAHHIRTRKAGGPDLYWNLMPLCREHHGMMHNRGLTYMASRFGAVRFWLDGAGWEYDQVKKKWIHPVEQDEAIDNQNTQLKEA